MLFDWNTIAAPAALLDVQLSAPRTLTGEGLWVCLVSSGRCTVSLPGASAAPAGSVLVLPPQSAAAGHLILSRAPLTLTPEDSCHLLCVQLTGQASTQFLNGLQELPYLAKGETCPAAAELMGRLAEEKPTHSRARSQLVFALLCELADADSAAPALPPLVQAAIEDIRANYAGLYGVEELSERLGVSKSHLVRTFTAAVGVPPTNGFTSKWIIYQALMAEGEPLLALISLIGSVITLAYLARFMHAVFLGQPGRNLDHIEEAPWVMRAPMLLMAFMVILTGVFPGLMLAPLNAALAEYGMPSLDVAYYGLATGPGAWDATAVAVLMLVAFGGCWLALRFLLSRVKIRVAPPHACGHDASREASRIPPEAIYPALVNLCTGNKPGSATCPLPELALSLCRALRQSLGRNGRINKERPSC